MRNDKRKLTLVQWWLAWYNTLLLGGLHFGNIFGPTPNTP